ncbi:hypothetical protein ABMA28_003162 [Loxostege sticticalis]|uniref:DDE Tnp4 domain-containing protein n=1 Tax=Loxostege sticticalis TaxID=481309 RepID=A0ABD0SV73_LOXSC
MELNDLIFFALGTYQIRQARSYYGEHIRFHGGYQNEICSEDINGREGITEYCFNCLVGRRTVGCCAHVMTLIWYLRVSGMGSIPRKYIRSCRIPRYHSLEAEIQMKLSQVAPSNSCVWYLRSFARTRRQSFPEGAERNEIIPRIYPREMISLYQGRVCVAARRNVQRAQNINEACDSAVFAHHHNDSCGLCGMLLFRRQTHAVPSGSERDELAARIFPREVCKTGHLLCTNCWSVNVRTMELEFTHTTNSSNHCFVPSCTNPERLLKLVTLSILKISMVLMITHMFKFWTGLTKENYFNVLNHTGWAKNSLTFKCNLPRKLLPRGARARAGVLAHSHRRISSLRGLLCLIYSGKSSVTRLLNEARKALSSVFVPLHLGLNNQNRESIINRNLINSEGLFGNRQERVPIVICDSIYKYLQKSSNYLFQKITYSLHNYRNLVKPFLIVASDGHIIDIFGHYPATESDASIMKALFQKGNNNELRRLFRENDVFILDRGFRDAIPFLETLGYKIYNPESLEQDETQLPTIKANKSRCFTLCRWMVEVVNGRFKRDFKLFRQEYLTWICTSFINSFHPLIVKRPDAEITLNKAIERKEMPNTLAELIIDNRINRFRAQFTSINAQLPELDISPEMTLSDLTIFRVRQHGSFRVEISDHLEVVSQATTSQEQDPVEPFGPERTGSVNLHNSAYEAFRSYWDDEVLSSIVHETNQFATKITSAAFQSEWYTAIPRP